ncbi:MAG: DUF2284 domain-containing protein [Candidatus Bathyarchaeia archaeon]
MKQDLEKYRLLALEIGAADAIVIGGKDVIIDERVRAKCLYPKCPFFGTNINCPPYSPDLDFVRTVVNKYEYGIFFCVKGDPSDFVTRKTGEYKLIGKETKFVLNKICAEIESEAFYDGYYFALAFGQGPCKSLWCPDKACSALSPGGSCRFALKARSSMEAMGMDVFKMASTVGWEVYPCGERADFSQIPHVMLAGLILVA